MERKIIVFSVIFLLTALAVSGCVETSTKTDDDKLTDEINYDSDILEIVNSSLDVIEENGEILYVEVTLYFRNLLDDFINVIYRVDFCDTNDNAIYSKEYNLNNIPGNYRFKTPDVFSYDGENVGEFDHINVYIVEYEII